MAHIAYIRVSSVQQNTERQLADTGITFKKVFTEKVSGKDTNRPEFAAMMEYVREGDTLHVHSIDRLCRKTADLLATVERLTKEGVKIHFHKDNVIVTGDDSSAGKLILTVLAGVAQMERERMLERQREGREAAKAAGRMIGRGKGKAIDRAGITAALAAGGTIRSVAADFGVGVSTVARIKKERQAAAEAVTA